MTAREAKERTDEVVSTYEQSQKANILHLIGKAAGEGQYSVKYHNVITKANREYLTELGYNITNPSTGSNGQVFTTITWY